MLKFKIPQAWPWLDDLFWLTRRAVMLSSSSIYATTRQDTYDEHEAHRFAHQATQNMGLPAYDCTKLCSRANFRMQRQTNNSSAFMP